MGTPIMANKTVTNNPINSLFLLLTNTIYSARIYKKLGDGDYPTFLKGRLYRPFFMDKLNLV